MNCNIKRVVLKAASLISKSYKVPQSKIGKVRTELSNSLSNVFSAPEIDFDKFEKEIDFKTNFYSIAYPKARIPKSLGIKSLLLP